jgi:hypothetical protein
VLDLAISRNGLSAVRQARRHEASYSGPEAAKHTWRRASSSGGAKQLRMLVFGHDHHTSRYDLELAAIDGWQRKQLQLA